MKFSLNFVWINAVKHVANDSAALSCPIPQIYQENVARISSENPDIPITIWMDLYGPGKNTTALIEGAGKASNIPDITFRSLDEVASFTTNPLFRKHPVDLDRPYDPLWQQTDLARLIVIDKIIASGEFDAALYSDFSREITPEILKTAERKLKKYGVVVGDGRAYEDPTLLSFLGQDYSDGHRVENQFFGFRQNQLSFFREGVVFFSSRSIATGANGWEGFSDAFNRYGLEAHGLSLNDIAMTVPRSPNARSAKAFYSDPKRS
ncbi:MAG: hypothetical protein AAF549_06265 [Pseudomonadota bacterium]